MKITKELLEHLKVKTISLDNCGENVLCFLERIDNGKWTFSITRAIDLSKNKKLSFLINFYEYETSILCAKLIDSGEDWCEVIPEKENIDSRLALFLSMISKTEAKYESFGRRKEARVKIGKEKFDDFGLGSLKQKVFLSGAKFLQPCVVLDASVHGICIITQETPAIKNEENISIKLSFQNPEQTVILNAHKVYSRLSKTRTKSFLTLSCQLLEPIHFAWKERIISMIEKQS